MNQSVTTESPPINEPLLPGQLRSGAHIDFGTMTLLFHRASAEGLEIQRPDGSWILKFMGALNSTSFSIKTKKRLSTLIKRRQYHEVYPSFPLPEN